MRNHILIDTKNRSAIFSFFSIALALSILSFTRIFFDLNVSIDKIFISFIESIIITAIFFFFFILKDLDSVYIASTTFLKLHVFAILIQAFIYPDMQNYVALLWGTDVAANFASYQFRFIGLAGSYVPASILCALLLIVSLYPQYKVSKRNRFLFIILSIIGSALTARTGLLVVSAILFMHILITALTAKKILLSILTLFLVILTSAYFVANNLDNSVLSLFNTGIVYQLAYIKTDVIFHFSQEWSENITFVNVLLGTGSSEFAPGDNGYTMLISQHGLILLILFFIPYIYLISIKHFKVGMAIIILLFLSQLKTDFFFSTVYMFITLSVIKKLDLLRLSRKMSLIHT